MILNDEWFLRCSYLGSADTPGGFFPEGVTGRFGPVRFSQPVSQHMLAADYNCLQNTIVSILDDCACFSFEPSFESC